MSINVAELARLEDKLVADIKFLNNLAREIRAKQPVGADIVQIASSVLASATATITTGNNIIAISTVTPSNQLLTIWNILVTLKVNDTGQTLVHWPDKNDDSGHLLGEFVRLEGDMDFDNSADSVGIRKAFYIVENNDSHTLDIEFKTRWYGIQQTI